MPQLSQKKVSKQTDIEIIHQNKKSPSGMALIEKYHVYNSLGVVLYFSVN